MQKARKFRQVDYVVIAVLYLSEILKVWTGGWVTFTDAVVFGADDEGDQIVPPRQGNVRIQRERESYSVIVLVSALLALSVKCVLCLILSLTVDLRNRKFLLHFSSLCLWVLTPVIGVVTTLTGSPALALLLSWLAVVLFVATPMKYCLIFNQRQNPLPDQTRLMVALFEFMVSCCSFLLHCSPDPQDFQASTVATVWAVVITPFGLILILLTLAIKSHYTSERPKERSLKELSRGILRDAAIEKGDSPETARKKKMVTLRFVMFALLLCPAVAATIILEAHDKVTRSLTTEVKLEQRQMQFLGAITNLLAIPVISLIVSLSKGTRGTLWDFMLLALAHILNTVIMLLIYLYFLTTDFNFDLLVPPSNQSSNWLTPITKQIPAKGRAVLMVYFHGPYGDRSYFFQSSLDRSPKKLKLVRELIPVNGTSLQYDFSVWEDGGPRLNQSIVVEERKRYFFVCTGTTLNLRELVYVPDVEDFTPQNADCILVMSSVAEGPGSSLARQGLFNISQRGTVIRSSRLPLNNSSMRWCVPAEKTIVSFEMRSAPVLRLPEEQRRPYRESLALVSWEPSQSVSGRVFIVQYVVTQYGFSDVVNKTTTLLITTHGLEGVVAAAARIGYVQFFWMEAPLRLRTTLFACTVVANEVAAWFVNLLFEEIRMNTSLALLILSATAGSAHVILGLFYEFKFPKHR